MTKTVTVLDTILGSIVENLEADMSRCGFMYHVFSRTKSESSIKAKLSKKTEEYRKKSKKMQDLLALRITLYFSDDVEILHQYLKAKPNFLDETIDDDKVDIFRPKRLNLVMNVPEEWRKDMSSYLSHNIPDAADLIDLTYEIQIRTILSEGWHEVEHDLRYKCQEDWEGFKEESRLLNGIFASLESSEWSMLTLFDKMAYSFYKKQNWTNMIRNKMRIRFNDKGLSDEVTSLLSREPETAKSIFRVPRSKVIRVVLEKEFKFPLQYDTIVHLLNRTEVRNKLLADLETSVLKKELDGIFGVLE